MGGRLGWVFNETAFGPGDPGFFSETTFGPGDPGSNPSWFTFLNSNQKSSFIKNITVWYSSKYCNAKFGDNLRNFHNAQLVYLNEEGSWYQTFLSGRYCTGQIRRMLNQGGPSKH